jgi:hypothetical protein
MKEGIIEAREGPVNPDPRRQFLEQACVIKAVMKGRLDRQNIDRPSSLRKDLDKIEPSQRTRPSERGEKVKAEQNASIHF